MNCHYCNKPIENQRRSTKKYCNDTCKQYAYLKRCYMQPSDIGKVQAESADTIIKESQSDEPANATTKREVENNVKPQPVFTDKVKYKKIRPAIIEQLNGIDFSEYKTYFSIKGKLTRETFPHFVFICPRIRCVVENMVLLGYRRKVHYKTIAFLCSALAKTLDSEHYRAILKCGGFPFTNDINKLCFQMKKISLALKQNKEGIKLTIDKASLLRYIILLKVIREFSTKRYSFRNLFPELYEPQTVANKAK